MSTTPAGFSIDTITRPEWTTNTWLTTTGKDSSSTVVPVIVGCPGCGGDGGGIIVWDLPATPGVEYDFPSLPSLPKFQLPCIQVLGMSAGNCPGPNTNPEDNGGSDDDPSSTKSEPSKTETSQETTESSTTTSESSCTQTKTASDCAVTCKPTTTASTITSITCFTTACSQTITGCDVTGTTTTTTSTSSCSQSTPGVGRRADSCELGCPSYEVPHDPDDPSDDEIDYTHSEDGEDDESQSAKRALVARAAKQVDKFAGCVLATPAGSPLAIPSNPPGGKFWKQDKVGFKNAVGDAKIASQAIPRWYSTAVAPEACAPTVVKVDVASYPDGGSGGTQRATIDHSWEKGWLTDFFDTIIDDSAPAISGSDAGNGKMTCDDFNKYVFDSGNQNFISGVYAGLPSKEPANMDFIGMTDNLNADCKGAVSNPDLHLKKIPTIVALDVTDPDVNTALNNMNQKFTQLERIRLGVYMTNLDENKQVADTTNNRLHALMQQLDQDLGSKYSDVASFDESNWFFTRQFQSFMDNLVADADDSVRRKVKDHANSLISDITSKMETLAGRESELNDKAPGEWRDMQTKWNYYKALGPETWDISLSWSWGCGRKRDGTPGACVLPPRSSSTVSSATSSPSSTTASSSSTTQSGSGSAQPSQTSSGSVPVTSSSAAGSSSQMSSPTITSTFATSTLSGSCTYVTPSLTGDAGPYCTYYYAAQDNVSQCNCDDGKTYAPYSRKDGCQPACPLTSPGDGYSEISTTAPPTTASEFQSFTTTNLGGDVQVCTSLSAIGNGIPGSACVGPTISTESPSPTPTPSPSLIPQGQKTCYSGSELQFDRGDVQKKISDICKKKEYWKGVSEVYYKGEIGRYTSDGDKTDDAKVSISVQEDDMACPEGMDLDAVYATKLNSDVCEDNLMGTVDGCDTNSSKLKHGGILWADCLSWEVRIDAN